MFYLKIELLIFNCYSFEKSKIKAMKNITLCMNVNIRKQVI